MNYSIINQCPATLSKDKVKYFDLGNIPLVNNLCNTQEESLKAERYPLSVNYFIESGESALECAVNSDLLFSHYLFKSEINKPYYKHCLEMFDYIKKYINIHDNSRIVDIGGNDGTLLSAFKEISNNDLWVLNIDPSKNLLEENLSKNIPVLNEFFTYELALRFIDKVDIITSTNVFQHLKDLNSFVKGIKFLLKPNGIWVLEFPYWIHDMQTKQFDQVYHEHMYYHSITPLKTLFEKYKLKIVNITKQKIHGGTLRLIITHESSDLQIDDSINYFVENEKQYDLNYHINWGKEVIDYMDFCSLELEKLLKQNNKIYGFGAAAKGCIFLNSLAITYKEIPYIIDDTDIKQGKFIPGTGIEVVNREFLKNNQPDYILILAHNFADHIIDSLKDIYQGKFIMFLPEFKIIE